MRLPRFLWVPFELGRPFGAPHEPDLQRRVLRASLELLERPDGPVVLEDFPEDAPFETHEAVWSCPVSFAPRASDDSHLVQQTIAELRRLAPWTERADGVVDVEDSNSGLDLDAMVRCLGRIADGLDVDVVADGRPLVEITRLVCDDLHTWYLGVARRQPGRATSTVIDNWFWTQTALARLIGAVAARLLDHHDPGVRLFAARAIVPRAHQAELISQTPPTAGDVDV